MEQHEYSRELKSPPPLKIGATYTKRNIMHYASEKTRQVTRETLVQYASDRDTSPRVHFPPNGFQVNPRKFFDELQKNNFPDLADYKSISKRRSRGVISRSMDDKQNGSYFQNWKNKQNNDSNLRAWDIPGLNIQRQPRGSEGKENHCIERDLKNGAEVIRVNRKSKNLIVKTNPAFSPNRKCAVKLPFIGKHRADYGLAKNLAQGS
jgi:hypothetical protein